MDLQELGRRIYILRKQKKFSQIKVAEDLGISVTAYTRFENGQTNLSFNRLIQLADYFECRLEFLLAADFSQHFGCDPSISSENFSALNNYGNGALDEMDGRYENRFEQIEKHIAQLETQFNLLHKQLKP